MKTNTEKLNNDSPSLHFSPLSLENGYLAQILDQAFQILEGISVISELSDLSVRHSAEQLEKRLQVTDRLFLYYAETLLCDVLKIAFQRAQELPDIEQYEPEELVVQQMEIAFEMLEDASSSSVLPDTDANHVQYLAINLAIELDDELERQSRDQKADAWWGKERFG